MCQNHANEDEGDDARILASPISEMIKHRRGHGQYGIENPELKKNAPVVLLLSIDKKAQERDDSPLNDVQGESKVVRDVCIRKEEQGIPEDNCYSDRISD